MDSNQIQIIIFALRAFCSYQGNLHSGIQRQSHFIFGHIRQLNFFLNLSLILETAKKYFVALRLTFATVTVHKASQIATQVQLNVHCSMQILGNGTSEKFYYIHDLLTASFCMSMSP